MSTDDGASTSLGNDANAPAKLRIRCLDCHAPFEVVADTPLQEIACANCGGHFALAAIEAASVHSAPGTQIGHFTLVEKVGVGGFGTVWKALDTRLDRYVALKMPRRTLMDADETEKFLREARTAAQLRHPNIVSVHEVGWHGDTLYIVSDWVEGMPLDEWLDDQTLTAQEAGRLCAKIAAALDYAHQAGIIHRDVKPANIIMDGDGEPHLTDFGLAKREMGEITMTIDGQVMGTPAYMSPEQAQGGGHGADVRSDVYSLGVVLFQLATGELPFRGSARMVMHQVISDEAPSPRRFNASIPRDLETITLKCLEKKAEARYARAQDVADELRRFLRHEPIVARPVSRPERAWRWAKRQPVVAALAGTVLLVLVAGSAVSSYFGVSAALRARDADAQRDQAEKNLASADARFVEAQIERAFTVHDQGYGGEALVRLSRTLELVPRMPSELSTLVRTLIASWGDEIVARPEAIMGQAFAMHPGALHSDGIKFGMQIGTISPDGEHVAIGFVDGFTVLIGPGGVHELAGADGHEIESMQFSPDGRWLAVGNDNGTVRLWSVADLNCRTLVEDAGEIHSLAFARDGSLLMTGDSNSQTRRWSTESLEELAAPREHGGGWVQEIAYSPDGSRYVCADGGSGSPAATVWDTASGERTGMRFETSEEVHSVKFSPDGKLIVTGDRAGYMQLWDAATGDAVGEPKMHEAWVWDLAFNHDGSLLAVGSANGWIKLWDTHSQRHIGPTLQERIVTRVEFAATHDRLLSVSRDRAVVWNVKRPTSSIPRDVFRVGNPVVLATFAGGGSRVVTVSGTASNLAARDGAVLESWDYKSGELLNETGSLSAAAGCFSSDGSKLICAGPDGVCHLLDSATGNRLAAPVELGGAPHEVVLMPDEDRFVAVTDQNSLQLWSFSTKNQVREPIFQPTRSSDPAISPDGTTLAAPGWGGRVRILDVASDEPLVRVIGGGSRALRAAFSPDGSLLAASSENKTVSIWDVGSGQRVSGPLPHSFNVWTVAFSPDGRLVATGSGDWETTRPGEASVALWDVRAGRKIAEWEHPHHVSSVAFHPDGKSLLSACFDGNVRVWRVPLPFEGDPERIRVWTELITGLAARETGTPAQLSSEAFAKRQQRLEELGGPPIDETTRASRRDIRSPLRVLMTD